MKKKTQLLEHLESYLTLRRSMGLHLRDQEKVVRKFLHYLDQKNRTVITLSDAIEWSQLSSGKIRRSRRLGHIRIFARYVHAIDPRTEIPPREIMPYRYEKRLVHIYSQLEISQVMAAAGKIISKKGLRAKTYETFFGLLAVTGLRLSEAIELHQEDVNLLTGTIVLRRTKFGKSRLIPLHKTTTAALRNYAMFRDQTLKGDCEPFFFLSECGTQLCGRSYQDAFAKIAVQIGLRKKDKSGNYPRIHDFRHSFAVHTLADSYKQGKDGEKILSTISTYLGHVSPVSTYWYLSGSLDLMSAAATLLEKQEASQ